MTEVLLEEIKGEEKGREFKMVNHPSHYNFSKYEVWDVLDEWFPRDPLLWQACKYLARAGHKGNAIEDLRKALVYINRRIDNLVFTKTE